MLIDRFIQWGVFAVLPLYLWLGIALSIGIQRGGVRNGWLAGSIYFLSFPLMLVMGVRDHQYLEWVPTLLVYFCLLTPLIPVVIFIQNWGRQTPFRYPANILLFCRPGEAEVAPTARQRWAMLSAAIGLVLISFASHSLWPCNWLDRVTHQSGCVRVLRASSTDLVDISLDSAGVRLAVASGNVTIWTLPSTSVSVPIAPLNPFSQIALSPDGRQSAIGDWDANTRILITDRPEVQVELPNTKGAQALRFFPDNQTLAIGFEDAVEVWDTIARARRYRLPTDGSVDTIATSPDGTRFITGGYENAIDIWDTQSGRHIKRLSEDFAYDIALSPDGQSLAAGRYGGLVDLLDMDTGVVVASFRTPRQDEDDPALIRSVGFNADGTALIAGSSVGEAIIWDISSGRIVHQLHFEDMVRRAAFLPGGQEVVVALSDGTIRFWAWPR